MQMKGTKTFDEICQQLEINKNQLGAYIQFLKEVDYQLDYSVINGKQSLTPPNEQPTINIEFNLLEWLQFQAHFPAFASMHDRPFHQDIHNKFSEIETSYSNHDVFDPLETLQELLSGPELRLHDGKNSVISFLEESILDQKYIRMHVSNRPILVYPHRIVYLDGRLSLVAEDAQEKCLINISIDHIQNLYEESFDKRPIFSKYEVADFILGLRDVTGNEVRLILKVYSYEKFDPRIEHHFLGNPCMITNPQGEAIWAASIEPTEKIFEWLEYLEIGRAHV